MSKRNREVKAEVEGTEAPKKEYAMREHLGKYKERYVHITSGSGNSSLCNGDEVAQKLAGKTPAEVVVLASRLLGLDLGAKYAGLNAGQQRMNCGNRLRSAVKKGTITIDQL